MNIPSTFEADVLFPNQASLLLVSDAQDADIFLEYKYLDMYAGKRHM
jgi:hypothetical protein